MSGALYVFSKREVDTPSWLGECSFTRLSGPKYLFFNTALGLHIAALPEVPEDYGIEM